MKPNTVLGNRNCLYFISPENIVYMQADGAYSVVKMNDGAEIRMSKNTKQLMKMFSEVDFLFRIHRSWVVNTKFIKGIYAQKGTKKKILHLKGDYTIPVASIPKKELLEILGKASVTQKK